MENTDEVFFGKLQNVKTSLIVMINEGQDPYDIINALAGQLELLSGEQGYAAEVEKCLNAVYGLGLRQEKPLSCVLEAVQERIQKISASEADGQLPPEVKKRLHFALEQHQNYANFLQEQLRKNR